MGKWGETPREIAFTIRITKQEKEDLQKFAEARDVKASYLGYEIIHAWLKENGNDD